MPQENHNAPQSLPSEDDVVSLMDIINFLQNGWKVIVIASILGLGIGGSYAFLTPSKFQAEVIVQGALVAGQPVETSAVLIEKLKQPTYYSQNTLKQCGQHGLPLEASTLAKELKLSVVKSSPLINLSYRSSSTDSSIRCLEAILQDIQQNQDSLPKSLLVARESQLQQMKQQLETSEKVNHQLMEKFSGKGTEDSALVSSIILSRSNEIADLRRTINFQEADLLPPQTQQASMATPIYAPDAAVYPKKVPTIAGGFFGGTLLGILWLLARQSWQKIKPQLHRQSI